MLKILYDSEDELNLNRERKNANFSHSHSPSRLRPRLDEPYEDLSRSLIDLKNQQKEELETLKANYGSIEDLKRFIRSKTNPEKQAYAKKQVQKKSENLFARLDDMKVCCCFFFSIFLIENDSKINRNKIKRESDSIRRKYEKLNYEDTLIQKYSYDAKK